MPGVPTFRGCEACHRQKKKCDEKQPACSRCSRLRIACEGRGNVRFKFVHNNAHKPKAKRAAPAKSTADKNGREVAPRRLLPSPLNFTVSSEVAKAASAFVSVLEVSDPRYDITCYGGWVLDLPRRLGANEALDASVNALSATFPAVHSKQITCKALSSYVKALEVLRLYIADPVRVREPETLCAIYLVMICQGWIGTNTDDEAAHIAGMVYLLQDAKPQGEMPAFEKAVRRTIGVAIILESISNPNINITDLKESLCSAEGPRALTKADGSRFPSLDVLFLSQIPDYLDQPVENIGHIRTYYSTLKLDTGEMHKRMQEIEEAILALSPGSLRSQALLLRQCHMTQAGYGLLLGLCVLFGSILTAFDPADQVTAFEVTVQVDLVLQFADYVNATRPLGASYMCMPLLAGWVATPAGPKRRQLEAAMERYQTDLPTFLWADQGKRLEEVFSKVAASRVDVM